MKIKEVEKMLQMNSQTIRYYEKLGFLKPHRDANGYRKYTCEDIKTLKKIRFLRELDIPLEMIERILLNQDEFQNVLDTHLKTLQLKIENLEEIQKICYNLNQKNIPLLDAVIDGDLQDLPNDSHNQITSIIQKAAKFIKPYPTITIGRKTTPYQLLKESFFYLVLVALVLATFIIYLKNEQFIHNINGSLWIISLFVLTILIVLILFQEKYYEFQDTGFYIFDSHHMKIKSIIAVLNNSTHKLARYYLYKDIDYVYVKVEKKVGGIGFGPVTYYNIIYQFHMLDGHSFEINSSLYNEHTQDRKSVYEILDFYKVNIIDERGLKNAFLQNELSIYEYLEKDA